MTYGRINESLTITLPLLVIVLYSGSYIVKINDRGGNPIIEGVKLK